MQKAEKAGPKNNTLNDKSSREILSPRKYQIDNLIKMGPNPIHAAQKFATNARFLAKKLFNKQF